MSEPEPNKDSTRMAEGDFKVPKPFRGLRQTDRSLMIASTLPQRLKVKAILESPADTVVTVENSIIIRKIRK